MRKMLVLLGVIALLVFPAMVLAQGTGSMHEKHEMSGPPKVLEIIREDSKPGKVIAHRKHEAAWTQALVKADPKMPHMLVISSVTGPDEDWFMTGFDNFAQFEKTNEMFESGPAAQVMATYVPKETDFVSESRTVVAKYRPDLSYQPDFNLGEYKYFNVVTVRYKIGAANGPEEIAKIIKTAREKSNTNEHQVVYQVSSGLPVGTYIYFTPVKSLASWDEMNKAYGDAIKEGGFYDAVDKYIQFAEYRLFSFSPRMSYVPDEVAKANPTFWHPKAEMAKAPAKAATPAAKKEATEKKQ